MKRIIVLLALFVAATSFAAGHGGIEGQRPYCESIGYVHAWVDMTPNIIYAVVCLGDSFGCGSPQRRRECQNCGKRQTKPHPTEHPWEDVK